MQPRAAAATISCTDSLTLALWLQALTDTLVIWVVSVVCACLSWCASRVSICLLLWEPELSRLITLFTLVSIIFFEICFTQVYWSVLLHSVLLNFHPLNVLHSQLYWFIFFLCFTLVYVYLFCFSVVPSYLLIRTVFVLHSQIYWFTLLCCALSSIDSFCSCVAISALLIHPLPLLHSQLCTFPLAFYCTSWCINYFRSLSLAQFHNFHRIFVPLTIELLTR